MLTIARDDGHAHSLRDPVLCVLRLQAGKLAFDFSEGLVVGLRLPDGAEREALRTKWADFSSNISSYVVGASPAHRLHGSRGGVLVCSHVRRQGRQT